MPNRRSGRNRSVRSLGDVTLNDFANSSLSKSRQRKSSNVTHILKKYEEEKSWDEKTEEYDGDFIQEVDEEGNVTYVLRKLDVRRRRKTISSSEDTRDVGNDYPIDIWFLISEYIQPQDVGRFAGICKTSFEVVCTARFWFGLYKRYYKPVPELPEDLQLESLVRKYGLRTSVIRALHYMYPPFVTTSRLITAVAEHPDCLVKRLCESLWHQKKDKHWVYYFKLREMTNLSLQHSRTDFKRPDLLEILDDVSANPDEHCRILQITCKHFIPIPPVIGQVLSSVIIALTQGFRYNKILLVFKSGIQSYSSEGGSTNTQIIIDPVINYKVLDWWHPLYPHSHGIQDLICLD